MRPVLSVLKEKIQLKKNLDTHLFPFFFHQVCSIMLNAGFQGIDPRQLFFFLSVRSALQNTLGNELLLCSASELFFSSFSQHKSFHTL